MPARPRHGAVATSAGQVRMECPSGIGIADTLPPSSPAARAQGGVDRLFTTHAAELRRYAQRIVRTRDAAEDVVQEVFLRLWLKRDALELGDGIRSYLFTSTRSRAIDALARARRVSGAEAHADGGDRVVGSEPDVGPEMRDDAPDGEAVAHAVAQVLAAMPPRQRAVATRRLHERRATADIARELGISPRTVEAHVARATKLLRARLPELLAPHQ